jgi:hypothetical protein
MIGRVTDRVQADQRLPECPERQSGIVWPAPIHERVDQLVAAARASGLRTTRKELVAALVLAASEDPDELMALLLHFRRATAREALVGSNDAEVIEFKRAKPGPR